MLGWAYFVLGLGLGPMMFVRFWAKTWVHGVRAFVT